MRARTIRVVFAAKLLKQLVLPALSLLSLPRNDTTVSPRSTGTQYGRQFLRPKSESKSPHLPRKF